MERRSYLARLAGVGAVVLAGCSESTDGGTESPTDTTAESPTDTDAPADTPTDTDAVESDAPTDTDASTDTPADTDAPTDTDAATETDASTETDTPTPGAAAAEVVVGPGGDYAFSPSEVEIATGETVEWMFDSAGHNVKPRDIPDESDWEGTPGGSFDTVDVGETYTHTFRVPGEYDYVCEPHAALDMKGTVIVVE